MENASSFELDYLLLSAVLSSGGMSKVFVNFGDLESPSAGFEANGSVLAATSMETMLDRAIMKYGEALLAMLKGDPQLGQYMPDSHLHRLSRTLHLSPQETLQLIERHSASIRKRIDIRVSI